jgi:hypothetical protein
MFFQFIHYQCFVNCAEIFFNNGVEYDHFHMFWIIVQQCRFSVSYKCGNCRKGIELDDEELRLVKCKICKMTQRREKLENTSHICRILKICTVELLFSLRYF